MDFCPIRDRDGGERRRDQGSDLLGLEGDMTQWRATAIVILLANFPDVVSAQANCDTLPAGPARTDCYIGQSRISQGRSDVAAGNARVQADVARSRQTTGTEHPRHKPPHQH
jgi:hypothetical protein